MNLSLPSSFSQYLMMFDAHLRLAWPGIPEGPSQPFGVATESGDPEKQAVVLMFTIRWHVYYTLE